MPKPTSDLERFLAGDLGETQDMPVAILLAAIVLLVIGAALVHAL